MAEPLPVGVQGIAINGRRRPGPEPIPVEIFAKPSVREALARREIGAVYKLLQRHGVSQRRIAALCGQSQSEISEIIAGRRVTSYDVLLKIAEGLGVPPGWMGLAHDDAEPVPSEVAVEIARIKALPFPRDVRTAILRAFVSGLTLAGGVSAQP